MGDGDNWCSVLKLISDVAEQNCDSKCEMSIEVLILYTLRSKVNSSTALSHSSSQFLFSNLYWYVAYQYIGM